jgi:hypothetical protein
MLSTGRATTACSTSTSTPSEATRYTPDHEHQTDVQVRILSQPLSINLSLVLACYQPIQILMFCPSQVQDCSLEGLG